MAAKTTVIGTEILIIKLNNNNSNMLLVLGGPTGNQNV